MHICTVTVTHVLIYTVLERLTWKIFWAKYVKLVAFCILQSFTSTDVDALREIIKKIYANKHCQGFGNNFSILPNPIMLCPSLVDRTATC